MSQTGSPCPCPAGIIHCGQVLRPNLDRSFPVWHDRVHPFRFGPIQDGVPSWQQRCGSCSFGRRQCVQYDPMASPTNCISYNVGLWPLGGIVVPRCDHRRCAFSVLYAQRSGYVHHVITRMDHSVWNHVLMYRPLKSLFPSEASSMCMIFLYVHLL